MMPAWADDKAWKQRMWDDFVRPPLSVNDVESGLMGHCCKVTAAGRKTRFGKTASPTRRRGARRGGIKGILVQRDCSGAKLGCSSFGTAANCILGTPPGSRPSSAARTDRNSQVQFSDQWAERRPVLPERSASRPPSRASMSLSAHQAKEWDVYQEASLRLRMVRRPHRLREANEEIVIQDLSENLQ
mmetsp:Transcript_156509/g.276438  ORF Transcript_156509/g.276438 Transcript_156509/m.276438 type:complete len:187 (-) Transcript_156509:206-766(-)